MRVIITIALAATLAACSGSGSGSRKKDDFTRRIKDADRRTGLLTLYANRRTGKVWLELPAKPIAGRIGDFLYVDGLATGLGSNPVGLDRGQLGRTRVVTLRVQGGRLLVEEQNVGFRALSSDEAEKTATRESFASSVLWAGSVAATASDGRRLVDLTSFIVRDAHGVRASLRRANQGDYALDGDRSAVDADAALVFEDNVVLEALLTYKSDRPGGEVSATAPSGTAFSVTLRHMLVRLPDDGYTPRPAHPRSGSFAVAFADYAAPLTGSTVKRWLVRHRMKKGIPLTYYVDRGIPEPVRSAVVEGASWWGEAFAAAGYPDGFKVELLPEDAHPLDVSYNVIEWVHRATRGWSYGGGIVDPRTGEMLKGHVSLGSLRVRQDRRIFEGLLGASATGSGQPDDPVQLALARIRQLSAHEVGHTLGFAHNFAASIRDRASVMDYPAPLVRARDGRLDVSEAYDAGIGAWDIIATRYAYTELAADAAEAGLRAILDDAQRAGLLFLSDADARPSGAAHPLANLWDNGADPIAALDEALAVRQVAIDAFGPQNLPPGQPLALLEEVFAPIYFYHRYQLEAAVKSVGGLLYAYPLRDDPGGAVRPVDAATQRRALRAVLNALRPEVLDVPESVLATLVPRSYGTERNRELFDARTAPGFDALGAARTAADMAIEGLLQPERAARIVDQHRRNPALPSFAEVVSALVGDAFSSPSQDPRRRQIQNEVQAVVVARLMALAADGNAPWSVRAEADQAVTGLITRVAGTSAFPAYLRGAVRRFMDRAADPGSPLPVPKAPPGSPIGAGGPDHAGLPAHRIPTMAVPEVFGACSGGHL